MAENLTFNLDVDTGNAVTAVNTFFNTFEQGATQAKDKLNKAFSQKLETEVKVEFKGGELVAKEVQKMTQDSNKLSKIYNAVNGELGRTPNQLKKQKAILQGLLGDTQKFQGNTRKVTAEWKLLTEKLKSVEGALNKMGTSGRGILGSLTAKFITIQTAANLATAGILQLGRDIANLVTTGIQMETLSLQLEAFTGGAEEAEAAMEEFMKIAANSPLDLKQVAEAGKIMMAFGISTEQAIESTKQLSVISAATGGDVNLLARNLGQVAAQGRAYTRDLTQFAIQGIPIWDELSVVTGKSVVELKDMARTGRIGFKEVEQAMANMTGEGTAMAEIANRMQETFAGRLAAIETAFQNLAGEAVKAFNLIDEALGGPVSNSMKAFAGALKSIANNAKTLGIIIATVTAAIGGFFAVMAIAKIKLLIVSLGGIISTFGLMKATILATLGAQMALMAAMGPVRWGLAAAAIAGAAVAFAGIKASLDEVAVATDEVTEKTGRLTEAEMKAARAGAYKEKVQAYKDARAAADDYKGKLDIELETLNNIKDALTKKHNDAVAHHKDRLNEINEKLTAERDSLKESKAAIKAKYDDEKAELNETLQLIRDKYSEEIAALQEMGPYQKQLYDFEKNKLKAEISSGKLQGEALLRAKARLERMEQQEKIAKLRKQQAAEEKPILDDLAKLEDDRKKNVKETTDAHDKRIKALEKQKSKEEGIIKKLVDAYKEQIKKIDAAAASAKQIGIETDISNGAIDAQIRAVDDLAGKWRKAEKAAIDAAKAVRAANDAEAGVDASGSTQSSSTSGSRKRFGVRFAGGPVSGGSTYTVNELGKEAFLSASGQLSMINAPSFGSWRAPSSGTVIPAHLTKQLDVPSGGININKGASGAASAAASGGVNFNRLASAIASVTGGDTVTNNVTIQSTNTTQAASDVMVQLAKLKRLRYN